MLRRDWHVQLDFAPKAGQPERLWVRVESVNGEHCTVPGPGAGVEEAEW